MRTSGVSQQQSINKDVSSARQVPANTLCELVAVAMELAKRQCFVYPQLILSPISRGEFLRPCVR